MSSELARALYQMIISSFLARRFWRRVAKVGWREDENWVTSFFNLGINVLRPGK